jgi:tetratricopeptide (TPR) repeat protein
MTSSRASSIASGAYHDDPIGVAAAVARELARLHAAGSAHGALDEAALELHADGTVTFAADRRRGADPADDVRALGRMLAAWTEGTARGALGRLIDDCTGERARRPPAAEVAARLEALARPSPWRAVAIIAAMLAVVIAGTLFLLSRDGGGARGPLDDLPAIAEVELPETAPPFDLPLGEPGVTDQQLAALDDGDARSWSIRGYAALRRGELDAAEAAFARALELAPGDGPTLKNRGILRHRRGQVRAAYRDLRAALAASPDDVDAMMELVQLYSRHGHAAETRRLLRRIVTLRPGLDSAWRDLCALGDDDACDVLE